MEYGMKGTCTCKNCGLKYNSLSENGFCYGCNQIINASKLPSDEDNCWFCKLRKASSSDILTIKLKILIDKKFESWGAGQTTTERYRVSEFLVPRCSICRKTHDFMTNSIIIMVLLVLLFIGITVYYLITLNANNPLSNLFIVTVICLVLYGIWKFIISFHPYPQEVEIIKNEDYCLEYPQIKELVSNGWKRTY